MNEHTKYTLDDYYKAGTLRHQLEKFLPRVELIRKYAPGKPSVLDVGCGYGLFLSLLKLYGYQDVTGLDVECTETLANTNLIVVNAGGPLLKWCEYDVVTSFDVIEHIHDLEQFMLNIWHMLKPGGIAIITTANAELGYRMRSVPLLGIPDDLEGHVNVHPPAFWLKLARLSGFEVLEHWKGEHLTHIKGIWLLNTICRTLGIDHKRLPVLNRFEQSFGMVLKHAY